jgi:ABC-2 type transport system ATP-binding protein
MNILEILNVDKTYGSHSALKNFNLKVPEKSILGLLGPNGAGKTSIIRIITQILAPDKGEVLFRGERLNQGHVQQIGYLPEERGLYKRMKVREQLIYLACLKGMKRNDAQKKIELFLEKMDLTALQEKNIDELSKGLQQKVQFIAATLHEPALLILDEPFSGFDPINSELLKSEILALREKGTTIILSTHRMDNIDELCDELVLINKGQKVLEGKISEIKNQYKKNSFTIEGRGKIENNNTFQILSLKNNEKGNFKAIVSLSEKSNPNELIQEVVKNAQIISFKEDFPSINEIFISKIKEASL